jgi:hypothetical protein
LRIDFDAVFVKFCAQHIADAFEGRGGKPLAYGAIVVKDTESDFRKGESNAFNRIDTMAKLSGLRA